MKKKTSTEIHDQDMRAEYDFSAGVRGRRAKALREAGYTLREYQPDGTYTETRVLGEKTVALDPDVWAYFPDSASVNRALRALIAIVPAAPAGRKPRRRVASK